jgi:predicted anti-sigma-YlaC factor YlaD
MTLRPTSAMLCDRAHEWISLRLDGELSQLESVMLDAHLERCESCRRFASEVQAFTRRVRGAELEPVSVPVAVPRRRHVGFAAVRVGAAAAVMLVAVGLGTVFAPAVGREQAPQFSAARLAAADERQLRELRLAQLRLEMTMMQMSRSPQLGHVI